MNVWARPRPGILLVILIAIAVGWSGLSLAQSTIHASLSAVASGPIAFPASSGSTSPAIDSTGIGPASLGAPSATCREGDCSSPTAGPITSATPSPQWTNLTSADSPPWSYSEAMTYDNGSQSVLLFGTNASGGTLGDGTWEFAGGEWKHLAITVGAAPPYQTGMSMAYDGHDGYVLMFGCPGSAQENGSCNDTWEFTGGTWHQIDALNPPLASDVLGRYGQVGPLSLAYDAKDSYPVLTNGYDTWKYSGGTWSPFCRIPTNCSSGFIPGPNLYGTAVYDAHDGYVLFVGVADRNGSIVGGGSWTWEFVSGQWTNISTTVGTPPSPRLGAMMTYDSTTSNTVLFGGTSCPVFITCGFADRNDTWAFQNGAWQNVTSGPAPPARSSGQIADDPTDSSVILFSGVEERPEAADTWAWGIAPPIAGLSISVHPTVPVPGAPALFNSSFQGGVSPFTYNWRFGDGGGSALPNPSHVFSADGYYPVNLWVNDSAGHTAHTSIQVDVYLSLTIATLQANPNPAILDQPVNFTVDATGGTPPYTYAWAFGDGGVGGNLSSITHVYTTNGPFQAAVTVNDGVGGVAQASLNISIKLQALAGSSASAGTYPFTVSFVGQAQGGVPPYHYAWSFGDGTTAILQNPHHTYNFSGQFAVVLTVADSKNNRSSSSLTIEVRGPSAGGPAGPDWFSAFVIALVVVAGVATVRGVTGLRQQTRRREGERWIEELTHEETRDEDRMTRPR
jgi:PKD repeat protein